MTTRRDGSLMTFRVGKAEQCAALYDALKMILPLAEAYLAHAPTHPDNAKLEDARAALRAVEGEPCAH